MCSDKINKNAASQADSYQNSLVIQKDMWLSIMLHSQQLLQLAYQKNWTSLMDTHQVRDDLIEQFFKQAIASELVEQIQQDIITIKAQDEEIVRLVKNNQQQLGSESQQLNVMKKRINSYLSAEGKKL